MTITREFYRRVDRRKEGFWAEQASSCLAEATAKCSTNRRRPSPWFVGGETKPCYNALDQAPVGARGDQKGPSSISHAKTSEERSFSYRTSTSKFSARQR